MYLLGFSNKIIIFSYAFADFLGISIYQFMFFAMMFLITWSFFWKGWALWIAARKTNRVWFIVILLVNTLGILEIGYIIWNKFFQKDRKKIISFNISHDSNHDPKVEGDSPLKN